MHDPQPQLLQDSALLAVILYIALDRSACQIRKNVKMVENKAIKMRMESDQHCESPVKPSDFYKFGF